MGRLWAEHALWRERKAESVRSDAVALFQAATAVLGGKKGVAAFNKWLKELDG